MRDRERERERQRHRQREKQAPCREPNVGLDPGTPGSRSGLKAGAQLLSHPGIPRERILSRLSDKNASAGSPGGSAVWCLPLAQGVILESQDRVPRQAPCMEPAFPSACVSASLSLSLRVSMNK